MNVMIANTWRKLITFDIYLLSVSVLCVFKRWAISLVPIEINPKFVINELNEKKAKAKLIFPKLLTSKFRAR
jgi:hypothetical protein